MIHCEFEHGSPANLRHQTMDVIVVRKGEILLAQRAQSLSTEPGKWCLPGGYLDRDETVAEGAVRELREETGYEAGAVTPFRFNSKPDRPGDDRQNVNFVFIVEAGDKVGERDHETADVRWFPLDELPPSTEIAFDHEESIELYRRYLAEGFAIPLVD